MPVIGFAAEIGDFLADSSVVYSKCSIQEDFTVEYEVKKIATERETEKKKAARDYYYLAVLRYSQMQSLKSDDRLESARHYVAINNLYYHQSLDFLNQSMVLDPLQEETGIHFLKILIYHQLHNETAAGIEFSRLCNSISDIKDEGRKLQTYQDVNKLLMRYDCSEYALELYGAYFEYLNEVSSPDVAIHVLSAGDLLLKEKSYLQAYQLHRQYLSLIEDEKKQQEETLVVADKYFAARAYQEALLFYESYLMNAGELGDYALFRQAESYYEVSQLDKAITLYEALIETYPDGEYYVLSLEALEDSYLNKNDFYNLSVIYSKMADAYPEDSYKKEDAYYHMAHAFFMDKNYRAAKEAFVDFINQYPDSNYTEACQKYLERIEKALEDSNVED